VPPQRALLLLLLVLKASSTLAPTHRTRTR
jgi:hypothetical protein